MKAATATRERTVGFGCPTTDWPHHYAITIPRDRRAPVILSEDDGMGPDGSRHAECVGRATWDLVAPGVAGELNARLKAANLAPGSWKVGENRIERTLGKEVELLLMAACHQDAEVVPAVLANWKGLRPDERWWLHRKASSSGAWREAVGIGLAENPVD